MKTSLICLAIGGLSLPAMADVQNPSGTTVAGENAPTSHKYVPKNEMFEDESTLAEPLMMSGLPQFFTRNPNSTHLAPLKLFSLKPQATEVKNQHATGLCTSFATIAAMELVLKQKTGKDYDFSELSHFSIYHDYKTELALDTASKNFLVEEGAFKFIPSMNTLEETEIYRRYQPSENFKPYVSARISKYSIIKNQLDVISELASGHPVVLSAGVNSSFDSDLARRTGQLSRVGRDTPNGHAMLIVGYKYNSEKNVGNYIVKNSWGSNWGDNGFAYLPFDYCGTGSSQQYCSFYAVQDVQLKDVRPQDPTVSEIGIWSNEQKNWAQSSFGIEAADRVIDMIQSITYVFDNSTSDNTFTRERSTVDGSLDTAEGLGDHPDLSMSALDYALIKLMSGKVLKIEKGLNTPPKITPTTTDWCSGNPQPAFCTTSNAPSDWTETANQDSAERPLIAGYKVTSEDFYVWTETNTFSLSDMEFNRRLESRPQTAAAPREPDSDVAGVKVSKKAWPLISKIEISLNDQTKMTAERLGNFNYIVDKSHGFRTAFTEATITLKNGQVIQVREGAQTLVNFENLDQ